MGQPWSARIIEYALRNTYKHRFVTGKVIENPQPLTFYEDCVIKISRPLKRCVFVGCEFLPPDGFEKIDESWLESCITVYL